MDLNDAVRAGVDLASLVAAADNEDHILGGSWQALIPEGIKALSDLADKLEASQDKTDGIGHLSDVQGDPAKRRAIAIAMTRKPADASVQLMRLERRPSGMSRAVSLFEKALRTECDVVVEMLNASESRHRTASLDALLRPLGVTGLKVPRGYEAGKEGITDADGKIVANAPIVIVSSGEDLQTKTRLVELAWMANGRWHRQLVERRTAMDARAILKLADYYAPVSSVNASQVVRWLADYESENVGAIVDSKISHHMGWVEPGVFLLGEASIGGSVTLADDSGHCSGYRKSGTAEGWSRLVNETLSEWPVTMAAIYASAASPLLEIVGAQGFAVDWSGETSKGKTTTLRVAASVWGSPDEHGDGIIRSWSSASTSSLMYQAWLAQSVPVILDDTKRARNDGVVSVTMYDIPSGQERTRSKQDGTMRQARKWRTVLLSTGEAPLSSFSTAGGGQARILCLSGSPLGDDPEVGGPISDLIRDTTMEHYGHVGPAIVEWLIDPDNAEAIRKRWAESAEMYAERLGTSVGRRVAGYMATIECAAHIIHGELGLIDGDASAGLGALEHAAREVSRAADVPRTALDALWSWASANESKFHSRTNATREPSDGWVGTWGYGDAWTDVLFRPQVVDRLLDQWGYKPGEQISVWHKRGWTQRDAQGANPQRGRNGSRVIVLHRWALEGREKP